MDSAFYVFVFEFFNSFANYIITHTWTVYVDFGIFGFYVVANSLNFRFIRQSKKLFIAFN